MILEVCAHSLESALIAQQAGADRLEFCSELAIGGVTPSRGMLQQVREKVQIPVHVLYEDRQSVVIANDGSIPPGTYLAQSAAASLNRVLKAQTASGEQPGLHVHPDGTVHAAH